jgi:O-antigen/teichoic acid export membrane protein
MTPSGEGALAEPRETAGTAAPDGAPALALVPAPAPVAPGVSRVSRRLAKNLAWNIASEAAARGASLWLSFWLARVLSVEGFGRFAFAIASVQYAWLAGDAVANGGYSARELARLRGLGDPSVPALTGLFLRARVLAALVITPLALLAIRFAPLPAPTRLALLGALPFFLAFASLADWALRGRENFRGVALANGLGALALVGGTALVLPRWPRAEVGAAVWACSFVVPAVTAFMLLRRDRAIAAPTPGLSWTLHARRSAVFALGAVTGIGCAQMPQLLVGSIGTAHEAGLFSAAFRLVLVVLGGFSVMWWPLLPVLASTPPDSPDFRRAVRSAGVVVVLVSLPAAAVLALAPVRIMTLAFGSPYVAGAAALRIAALALPVVATATLLEQVCLGIGGERVRAVVFGGALAVMIGVAVVLIPRLGAVGGAIALLTGYVVAAAAFAITLRGAMPWKALLAGEPKERAS